MRNQDLRFLQDQKGPRHGSMAEEDVQFRDRVTEQLKRNHSNGSDNASATVTSKSISSSSDNNETIPESGGVSDDDDPSTDYKCNELGKKKPKTMLV